MGTTLGVVVPVSKDHHPHKLLKGDVIHKMKNNDCNHGAAINTAYFGASPRHKTPALDSRH